MLEEVGEVAAVKHHLERAIDLGLVNRLEDAVEGLDSTSSILQIG